MRSIKRNKQSLTVKLGIITLSAILLHSCAKQPAPLVPLYSDLIDGPWHLISATNNNSTGTVSTYKGMAADSILFLWQFDVNSNVVLTNINSFLRGGNTQCTYQIPGSQGTPNPYDTILCAPAFMPGYSDTLFVASFSDHSLVFKVRYATVDDSGVEIDSLSKIRFDHY